jgi:hypothetical protein
MPLSRRVVCSCGRRSSAKVVDFASVQQEIEDLWCVRVASASHCAVAWVSRLRAPVVVCLAAATSAAVAPITPTAVDEALLSLTADDKRELYESLGEPHRSTLGCALHSCALSPCALTLCTHRVLSPCVLTLCTHTAPLGVHVLPPTGLDADAAAVPAPFSQLAAQEGLPPTYILLRAYVHCQSLQMELARSSPKAVGRMR